MTILRSLVFAAIVLGSVYAIAANRPTSVAIFGDSMVAGISYDAELEKVVQVVDWRDHFPSAQVHGQSGAPTEVVLASLVADVENRHALIILLVGFNDLKKAGFELDVFKGDYRRLYGQASWNADKVICIGVPPMMRDKSDIWYPEGAAIPDERFAEVNAAIHDICGGGYIDTAQGMTSDLTDDGIHPNDDLASIIAGEIKAKFRF